MSHVQVTEGAVPAATVHSAQGGDVSNFQPVCDFKGYDFAYCKATEGTSFIDRTFAANFANAEHLEARGAYHFYHPSLSAIDQAHFFWNVVSAQKPKPGDFLVADIEIMVGEDGNWAASQHTIDHRMNLLPVHFSAAPPAHAGVLTSGSRLFLDTLAGLAGPHYPVLVYTNLNVGAQLTSCTGYDLIIAWPNTTPPGTVWPWKTWLMWQWAAGGGPCGGDSDAFNGTLADLQTWQARYTGSPPPPPPSVTPHLPSKSGDDMLYLPNGAGAVTTLLVPAAVPQADGTFKPPTHLRLATNAACTVQTQQGPQAAWSGDFAIDFGRGPNPITLDTPLPSEVKVMRVDGGTNLVTADFA